MGFRKRAQTYGVGDALVVYGFPLIMVAIVAAALVRLATATIFGR